MQALYASIWKYGIAALPVDEASKAPKISKHQLKTCDEGNVMVHDRMQRDKDAKRPWTFNIAWRMGDIKGSRIKMIAVDIDLEDEAKGALSGLVWYENYCKAHGEPQGMWKTRTGSGGMHLIFKFTEREHPFGSSTKFTAFDGKKYAIDIRTGSNNYTEPGIGGSVVIAPWSVHPSLTLYKPEPEDATFEALAHLQPMPEAMRRELLLGTGAIKTPAEYDAWKAKLDAKEASAPAPKAKALATIPAVQQVVAEPAIMPEAVAVANIDFDNVDYDAPADDGQAALLATDAAVAAQADEEKDEKARYEAYLMWMKIRWHAHSINWAARVNDYNDWATLIWATKSTGYCTLERLTALIQRYCVGVKKNDPYEIKKRWDDARCDGDLTGATILGWAKEDASRTAEGLARYQSDVSSLLDLKNTYTTLEELQLADEEISRAAQPAPKETSSELVSQLEDLLAELKGLDSINNDCARRIRHEIGLLTTTVTNTKNLVVNPRPSKVDAAYYLDPVGTIFKQYEDVSWTSVANFLRCKPTFEQVKLFLRQNVAFVINMPTHFIAKNVNRQTKQIQYEEIHKDALLNKKLPASCRPPEADGPEKSAKPAKALTLLSVCNMIQDSISYTEKFYDSDCRIGHDIINRDYFNTNPGLLGAHYSKLYPAGKRNVEKVAKGIAAIEKIMWHMAGKQDVQFKRLYQLFAHKVQHPAVKMHKFIIFCAGQGIGKTTLIEFFGKQIIGPLGFEMSTLPTFVSKIFGGDNNGYIANKSVVLLDDLKDGQMEKYCTEIKQFTTMTTVRVRSLYENASLYQSRYDTDVFVTANGREKVYIEGDSRRFDIFDCDDSLATEDNKEWFAHVNTQVYTDPEVAAAFYEKLVSYDLSDFVASKPPLTEAKRDAIAESAPFHVRFLKAVYLNQVENVMFDEDDMLRARSANMYLVFKTWAFKEGASDSTMKDYTAQKFSTKMKDAVGKLWKIRLTIPGDRAQGGGIEATRDDMKEVLLKTYRAIELEAPDPTGAPLPPPLSHYNDEHQDQDLSLDE